MIIPVSKETLVFLIGLMLTIVPFVGVPELWQQYAIAALGFLLVLVGYLLRRALYLRRMEHTEGERRSDSFVETTERLFE